MSTEKNKKTKWLIIKIVIAIIAWIFVFREITDNNDFSNSIKISYTFFNRNYIFLISIIVLMPINWIIEAIKWQRLINNIERISIIKSLAAVWTGVTIGSITPNRIGEFGGRIYFLKKKNRTIATGYTLFGDMAQFIITLCVGIVSFVLLTSQNALSEQLKDYNIVILITSLTAVLISAYIYLNINKILSKILNIKFLNKILLNTNTFPDISNNKKIETLIFSLLRYCVFSLQFYLSLRFFGIDLSIYNAFIAIASVYLAQTVIPNIPFIELGIRLSFSVIFIGYFTDKSSFIIFASTLIYLINIVIPIIIGSLILIFSNKVKK